MTANSLAQFVVFIGILWVLAKPLGEYMVSTDLIIEHIGVSSSEHPPFECYCPASAGIEAASAAPAVPNLMN